MVKGMSPLLLSIMAERDNDDRDFMDRAIKAVAIGEMEWRVKCQTN
jgi:hypothetical protein